MRKSLMSILGTLLLSFLFASMPAHANGHGEEEYTLAHQYEHVTGIAIHGEHLMWRQETLHVLKVAQMYIDIPQVAAYVDAINTNLDVVAELPTEAFVNDGSTMHINYVHPQHDNVANLVRLLNVIAPRNESVMVLNKSLLYSREMLASDALCSYAVNVSAGDGSAIDYAYQQNADMWENIDSHTPHPSGMMKRLLFIMFLSAMALVAFDELLKRVHNWQLSRKKSAHA